MRRFRHRRIEPLLPPGAYEVFRLHTQRVSDAGDVVKVADHLSRVMDRSVIEAVRSQRVKVGGRHVVLVTGELDGELAERAILIGERRGAPISRDRIDIGIRFCWVVRDLTDLITEVMRVRLRSIEAP